MSRCMLCVALLVCAGCTSFEDKVSEVLGNVPLTKKMQADTKALESRLSALESDAKSLSLQVARLNSQISAAKTLPEDLVKFRKLSDDLDINIDALESYFGTVSKRLEDLRKDMAGLLDGQTRSLKEGRDEYVRILRYQRSALSNMAEEVDRAIQDLEQAPPGAGTVLAPLPAVPAFAGARPKVGP